MLDEGILHLLSIRAHDEDEAETEGDTNKLKNRDECRLPEVLLDELVGRITDLRDLREVP